MSSSLGWIDFSSEDSAKVRKVLDLLSDNGVIDASSSIELAWSSGRIAV